MEREKLSWSRRGITTLKMLNQVLQTDSELFQNLFLNKLYSFFGS